LRDRFSVAPADAPVLIAAACLPDGPGPGFDLGALYEDNRFGLGLSLAVFHTGYSLQGIHFNGLDQRLRVWAGWVPSVVFYLLSLARRRGLDYALPLAITFWVLHEH